MKNYNLNNLVGFTRFVLSFNLSSNHPFLLNWKKFRNRRNSQLSQIIVECLLPVRQNE